MHEQRVPQPLRSTKLAESFQKLLAVCTLAAISAVALLGQPARGAGNTFYVAPTGNDGNDGSISAPFREIRRAVQVVQPGDTVYVADGGYLGFTVEDLIATADAPITFKALGHDAQILPTVDRGDNRDNISLNDSSYLIIDGLNCSNAPRAGIRVNTCDHVTVRNGVYGNNGAWGIFSGHADDLTIENNDCFGSVLQHGIYTSNSGDRPIIRFNRCHDNASCGIHMNGDASEPGDGLITGAVVEGNIIYNNGLDAVHSGSGINMDGVQNSIVRNNLLYNNHNRGISCFVDDGAAGAAGLRLVNNTISQAADGFWAINMIDTAGVNVIHNNILYHPKPLFGAIRCEGDVDTANTDSDYNMLDRATPDGPTRMPLADWQKLGKDLHSITLADKALFIDPANGDFRLGASAAAIDAGETLPDVTQDLAQQPRPSGSAYDIGCYEQPAGSTPPPPTPVTLTATAVVTDINLSWSLSPTATGYELERKDPGGNYVAIAGTSNTSYTDTGLARGTTYSYRVRATGATGNSGYVESSATTAPPLFTVSGKVTVGGVGVGGVNVAGGSSSTLTAADGTYTLTDFNPGNYGIIARTAIYTFPIQTAMLGPSRTDVNFDAPAGTDLGLGNGTYSISGKVTINAIGCGGVLVAGGAGVTFTADDGTYTLSGFPAGSYGVLATAPGYPLAIKTARVGPSKSGLDFDFGTYTISGKVTVGGVGQGGVNVAGGASSTTTAADGTYTLSGFTAGRYGILARAIGYTFPIQVVQVGPSQTGVNFDAPANPDAGGTYTISGTVTSGGVGVGGVLVSGGASSTTTAADGTYTLSGFTAGSYGILARATGYTFPTQVVQVGPSKTGVDFAAQ